MSALWGWLFNAPVWIQTPLVVVFLLALSAVLAFLVLKLLAVVVPTSSEERDMLAQPVEDPQTDGHRDSPKNVDAV
ncbi:MULTISPECIES: hypothetical protein [Corynebacterium]|uniref:hypothetical protein n=1 Tax=Corynebacterium TaxID=1716 RepID=UPI0008A27242|nr:MULTISPECIES: hypothetical protein [Corynebacterium]MCX2163386.1 hypothetical protein [Corynebacterium auriscanis]OFT90553.1 hypothetical protein HMPREF3098_03205 [Corynebacterium sp. HMSC28B08]